MGSSIPAFSSLEVLHLNLMLESRSIHLEDAGLLLLRCGVIHPTPGWSSTTSSKKFWFARDLLQGLASSKKEAVLQNRIPPPPQAPEKPIFPSLIEEAVKLVVGHNGQY
jgi:hypothetical protein